MRDTRADAGKGSVAAGALGADVRGARDIDRNGRVVRRGGGGGGVARSPRGEEEEEAAALRVQCEPAPFGAGAETTGVLACERKEGSADASA